MQIRALVISCLVIGFGSASAAMAACEGSNGRGWASGQGKGAFEMAAGDKTCLIRYPSFINGNNSTPATEVALTRAPASGKVGLSRDGLVYTPNPGFKGNDRFCMRNTAPNVRGTLSGCVTVTVR